MPLELPCTFCDEVDCGRFISEALDNIRGEGYVLLGGLKFFHCPDGVHVDIVG
jgi:hypothetical protein